MHINQRQNAILTMFGRVRPTADSRNHPTIILSKKMLRIVSVFAITIAALMTAFPAQAVFGDTRPAELATADKELNATYADLMKQLRKEEQEKLKKAQRIWISLREADCKWASAAEPLDCMIDRTLHRTEELKGSMFWAPNGEYTSLDLQK